MQKKPVVKQEYTAAELAKICDISLARVGQLAKEGIITKLSNGKYTKEAITQYVKFIRTSNEKSDYGELFDQEKYRKLKRENDLEEKQVAPVELLTDGLEKIANIWIPILEGLPLMIKRNWPEVTGDMMTLVKAAVAECRNAMDSVDIKLD